MLMREETTEKIAVTKMATEGVPFLYLLGRPEITTTGTRFCDQGFSEYMVLIILFGFVLLGVPILVGSKTWTQLLLSHRYPSLLPKNNFG